jgi:hypothetical protein
MGDGGMCYEKMKEMPKSQKSVDFFHVHFIIFIMDLGQFCRSHDDKELLCVADTNQV